MSTSSTLTALPEACAGGGGEANDIEPGRPSHPMAKYACFAASSFASCFEIATPSPF